MLPKIYRYFYCNVYKNPSFVKSMEVSFYYNAFKTLATYPHYSNLQPINRSLQADDEGGKSYMCF